MLCEEVGALVLEDLPKYEKIYALALEQDREDIALELGPILVGLRNINHLMKKAAES